MGGFEDGQMGSRIAVSQRMVGNDRKALAQGVFQGAKVHAGF